MKTKTQKTAELKEAEKFLKGSDALLFVDFNKVSTEDLRRLRREVGAAGASMLVLKKRLLNVMLKEKGIDMDARQFKSALGTVFSKSGFEAASGAIYKFFNSLGGTDKELKAASIKKILGGYDITNKEFADAQKILFYGQLPPREVALGMVLGMFATPLRAFMHILNEKAKKS